MLDFDVFVRQAAIVLLVGCGADSLPAGAGPDAARDTVVETTSEVGRARACNPVVQDCGDGQKCTPTYAMAPGGEKTILPTCVSATGPKGEGDLCARVSYDAEGIGRDDCVKGTFCSALGCLTTTKTPPPHHCWKLCAGDSACDVGKKCFPVTTGTPAYGVCAATCAAFGTTCPAEMNCANVLPDIDGTLHYLACREVGTVVAGSPCDHDLDCKAGLVCDSVRTPRTCVPLCDAAHACAKGSCFPIPGLGGAGACTGS